MCVIKLSRHFLFSFRRKEIILQTITVILTQLLLNVIYLMASFVSFFVFTKKLFSKTFGKGYY